MLRRNIGILLIPVLILSLSSFSGKETQKALKEADLSYEIGDYTSAITLYLEVLKEDSANADVHQRLGASYLRLQKVDQAIPHLERARKAGNLESFYHLGKAYHLKGKFDEEIELYQLYKNAEGSGEVEIGDVNELIEQAEYAKKRMDRPENMTIENIGSPINTEYPEYVPLTYGSEDELFFTSRRPGSTGGELDPYGNHFEDVYVSNKEHGHWTEPKQLNDHINTSTHDACVGISSDGQVLYLFRTSEDIISGDLYYSNLDENGWGPVQKLGSNINTEYIEVSASISADDRVLYFSSDREGGYGGRDIYRSVKLPNGEWSLAQNLGPTINTNKDEDAPFIHADSKTLYFSSRGHDNMGGYDIFKSELREDGLWTEPTNLGFPINTVTNDIYFVMSADKQTGYYSSAQDGGYGGQDIYVINFKLEAKILSVVKGGIASDDSSHHSVAAQITLINALTKEVQGIYKSHEKNGRFIMLITPEIPYTMIVEADGYHTLSKPISFDEGGMFGREMEEIKLIPIDEAAAN